MQKGQVEDKLWDMCAFTLDCVCNKIMVNIYCMVILSKYVYFY